MSKRSIKIIISRLKSPPNLIFNAHKDIKDGAIMLQMRWCVQSNVSSHDLGKRIKGQILPYREPGKIFMNHNIFNNRVIPLISAFTTS